MESPEKINEKLQSIADSCDTAEDVYAAVAELPANEKMRMVFHISGQEFFDQVKQAAVQTLDLAENFSFLNDYQEGRYRRENALGILQAVAKTFEMSTENNCRAELQRMDASSEYGALLSNRINDHAREVVALIETLIALDTQYASVLQGRRCDVHFINEDGDHVPFSQAELNAKRQSQLNAARDFDEWQAAGRQDVEDIYQGKAKPAPLADGETHRQLTIPLWVEEK